MFALRAAAALFCCRAALSSEVASSHSGRSSASKCVIDHLAQKSNLYQASGPSSKKKPSKVKQSSALPRTGCTKNTVQAVTVN